VPSGGARRNAPVHFDDALFAADLARFPAAGQQAVEAARGRYERTGVPAEERRQCHADHPSGTQLPGCMKVYVPDFGGPWRIVFQIAWLAENELGLEYVAASVGHVPRGTRRRDVYQLAHYRLHGRWPGR
jgi:hypothetical protein